MPKQPKTKRLPDAEWQFSDIEPKLIGKAFYYEYARQSEKISALVELYREIRGYYVQNPSDGSSVPSPELNEKQLAELKQKEAKFKGDEYTLILAWLSDCKSFPKKPFSKLKPKEIYTDNDFFNALPGLGDIGHRWLEHTDKDSFSYFFEEENKPVDCERSIGVHLLWIDWRKTDTELKNELFDWVKYTREQIGAKSTPELKRGIFNRTLDLPKECRKMNTALAHLGKLRGLEHAGTWVKYLSIYQDEGKERRYHEKDVSAARSVLEWMESMFCPPA